MIDVRSLRENPEPARASQRARGADPALVDQILEADVARREALQNFEALRATQKEVSKSVGRASKEERPAILAQAKELAEEVKAAEAAANAAEIGRTWSSTESPLAARMTTLSCATRAPRLVILQAKALNPKTTWHWVKALTRSTPSAARRFLAHASTTSRELVPASSWL